MYVLNQIYFLFLIERELHQLDLILKNQFMKHQFDEDLILKNQSMKHQFDEQNP